MGIVYDDRFDILYVDWKCSACDAECVSDGIYLRRRMDGNGIDMNEICGLHIEDFSDRLEDGILKHALKIILALSKHNH